ncbi:hypothetical protein N431DRAFT_232530 [Stipitochalara longipes BDJ]|nr:hypothetical protein N431DRAFT_232530 [Stipitochalara longipes BDJ]
MPPPPATRQLPSQPRDEALGKDDNAIDWTILKFQQATISTDANVIQSTTFNNLWNAVTEIERRRRHETSDQNMRHIKSFLKTLEQYLEVIQAASNESYRRWMWVRYY